MLETDAPHILIVDDDDSTHQSLSLILRRKGYRIEGAWTGQEALKKARGQFFNVVLLDIKLPDVERVDIIIPLKELHPDIVVILTTGYASLKTAVQAMNAGASAYITKPLNMDEVLAKIAETLEKQRLVTENKKLYKAVQEELIERKRAES
jgi:DNA-binding NtrC family response regulator